MISSLWQKLLCRMGRHVRRVERSGPWCRSVCVCCGYTGASHFIPLMKKNSREDSDNG